VTPSASIEGHSLDIRANLRVAMAAAVRAGRFHFRLYLIIRLETQY
jgi:hypothetical protein